MSKPRPTEVKLVANLLDPDAPNSEDAMALAHEIIEALDKSRIKRDSYIVVAKLADWSPLQAWGEFSTKLQAEKFVGKLAAPGPGSGRGAISKMEDPETYSKRMGE